MLQKYPRLCRSFDYHFAALFGGAHRRGRMILFLLQLISWHHSSKFSQSRGLVQAWLLYNVSPTTRSNPLRSLTFTFTAASPTVAAQSFFSSSSSSSSRSITQRWASDHNNNNDGNDSNSNLEHPPINGVGNKKQSRGSNNNSNNLGQTGWNHNLPSANPIFYQQQPSSTAESRGQRRTGSNNNNNNNISSNSNSKNNLRTGWLHNTEAPGKRKSTTTTTTTTTRQSSSNNIIMSTSTSPSSSGPSSSDTASPLARQRLELAQLQQKRHHRILHPVTFHAAGPDNGCIAVTEHIVSVPVYRNHTGHHDDDDYNSSEQQARQQQQQQQLQRLDLYFTIVERVDSETKRVSLESLHTLTPEQRAMQYVTSIAALENANSLCLYLQGGPGFGSPIPGVGLGLSADSSWAGQAFRHSPIERIVLMDQRGTGRSSPVTKQSLEIQFPDLFLLDNVDRDTTSSSTSETISSINDYESTHPDLFHKVQIAIQQTTTYLAQFRADNIVLDAEDIREALLMPRFLLEEQGKTVSSIRPWGTCLGQSFGGFCLMTYLSLVEHPPQICMFTGGIAPMLTSVYDVYESLWKRVQVRCQRYYEMYPDDINTIKRIVCALLDGPPVVLPSGGILTARRFLQLGMNLGGSPSSFSTMHAFIGSAFCDSNSTNDNTVPIWNRAFLKRMDTEQSFDDHPFYFWLHESIYADGPGISTKWAAHRVYETLKHTRMSEIDYMQTCRSDRDDEPVLLLGEMVFPWMSHDYAELRGVGLQAVADILANKDDWPKLYNGENMRKVLGCDKTIPAVSRAAAAVYLDDIYVDYDACQKVLAYGGPLEKCKVWVTNEYQHSGLRDDGAKIFAKLYGMITGSIRIPS